MKNGTLYYMANPYSHCDPLVMEERANLSIEMAATLFKMGIFVFAPIAYNCHWERHDLPGDWTTWEKFDKTYIDRCDGLIVLAIPGWKDSVGVTAEIEYARSLNMDIHYVTPQQIKNNEVSFLRRSV